MEPLLFMKPYVRPALWGREIWSVSAVGAGWLSDADPRADVPFPGESVVCGGAFDGMPLSALWRAQRALFAQCTGDTFPLLVKWIEADDDLSVQVHPDDEYARVREQAPFGKSECWYITDCTPDGDIIVGHHAPDKAALGQMVADGAWEALLTVQPLKKGDFYYIPAGTVHAIRRGTHLLEIQQTCNLTYRLYDYDRLDHGAKRPLHIDKALDVITCPQEVHPVRAEEDTPGRRPLLHNDLFDINLHTFAPEDASRTVALPLPDDCASIVCVTDGDGCVSCPGQTERDIKTGSVFLTTAACNGLQLSGVTQVITAAIRTSRKT